MERLQSRRRRGLTPLTELRERPDDDGKRPRGWSADLGIDGDFVVDVRSGTRLDVDAERRPDDFALRHVLRRDHPQRRGAPRDERENCAEDLDAVAVDGVVGDADDRAGHGRRRLSSRLVRRDRIAPGEGEHEDHESDAAAQETVAAPSVVRVGLAGREGAEPTRR